MPEDYQWSPTDRQIMTRWSSKVDPDHPFPEYPRPQFKRNEWFNLNGIWDYAIKSTEESEVSDYDGKILVPFPIESALSGVNKKLRPSKRLWYRRSFNIPKKWKNKNVLLHFGAVDWETIVWINKYEVGTHQGGYTPFEFEISKFLNFGGENELVVAVWDPTDTGEHERGKQSLRPRTIWYTAISGIWQTVWVEPVPKTFIKNFKLTPDIDNELISVSVKLWNPPKEYVIRAEIRDIGTKVNAALCDALNQLEVKIPSPKLWSPHNPFLYDLILTIEINDKVVDKVESYFGMRKIGLGDDGEGVKSIELNNEKIFQFGTLDQGYWPDGLYTAPNDEALRYDIEITKSLGFNMIRKHVKVEPARWYYHCDKIGILVWQDMPSGGVSNFDDLHPNINNFKDLRKEESKKSYKNELESMITSLFNSTCIITWVPFNEGWGQFDTESIINLVKKLDPFRLVDAASGWFDFGVGDIYDLHNYPNPIMPNKEKADSRAVVVGEFGGLGLEVEDHMWDIENRFVYRKASDQQIFKKKYERLITKLKALIKKGLAAAIYTQITDVEGEVNGLLTYDREILKIDKSRLREINKSVYNTEKNS
ncbi:MAG: beta-galactosidase [Candidatus Lokiarchaeota archaeon]|nr:beta-galactosidase [Candidatus Lokiarchaeota archaeon]MBD3338850.1 beta-galactosidase [Candidatus Lokiarchaeota archaeon]